MSTLLLKSYAAVTNVSLSFFFTLIESDSQQLRPERQATPAQKIENTGFFILWGITGI